MKSLKIRALQIDLARQKENLPYFFSYVDFAAENGYNAIFMYLENAIRTKSMEFFSTDDTYSVEEIKQMIDYADSKGVELIPALETLDHLEKFMVYPEFQGIGEAGYEELGRGLNGKPTCGCLSNESFYSFVETYVTEVALLFKSEYLHVGLDETFDFAACEKCQERIKNGETPSEMFLSHVMYLYNLCKKLGKRMMMWDDYFEYFDIVHDLPKDIIMCNWNYVFMSDQPLGHWTNRITKDWFALYDQLGIEYMFCSNAKATSSTFPIDSFYDYAMRYNPIGAILTAWERTATYYLGSYPSIAYAGRLFSGKAKKEDRAEIFTEILGGNRELAEIISSLSVASSGGYGNITKICETDYMIKAIYRDLYAYFVPKIEKCVSEMSEGLAKDIATDIYNTVVDEYQKLIVQKCAIDYFEGRDRKQILSKLKNAKSEYAKMKVRAESLWEKYRKGIKSANNDLFNKYNGADNKFNELCESVERNDEFGILYVELMLSDAYGTPHNTIELEYEDGEKETIFSGGLKPSVVFFEVGGCFQYRFAIKPKKIKALKFTAKGEGGTYPTYFRYSIGKNIYITDKVEVLEGHVINEHKLLRNDSRFAEMGYDDGVAHAMDITLCKIPHTISITFKKFE